MSEPVLRVAGLEKRYSDDGPAATRRGDVRRRGGRAPRDRRSVGRRQDDALRLLCGLMRPTAGTVHLDGHLVSSPPREAAIVFQDYSRSLFPWLNVTRNVMFPLRREREPRSEKLGRVEACPARSGARRRGEEVSVAALGRHAAARGDRARARLASGDPPSRRAVRIGGRADARRAPGSRAAPPSARGERRHDRPRHARHRRGRLPRRPRARAQRHPGAHRRRRSTCHCRDLASRRRPAARRSSFRSATSSTRSSPCASRYNPAPSDPPGTHRRPLCGCSVRAPGRSGRRRADEDQGRRS